MQRQKKTYSNPGTRYLMTCLVNLQDWMDKKNEVEGFTQYNRAVSVSNYYVIAISQTICINW